MHPVQAAPRQRNILAKFFTPNSDAPRAGSAEAKMSICLLLVNPLLMHPVQAAPRQRYGKMSSTGKVTDAPRAGSAEAKR